MARVALRCSDAQAELSVDGAPSGLVEDYRQKGLALRPGHHVFLLRSKDGSIIVREADLGPGDNVTLSVSLPGRASGSEAPTPEAAP
jgi:hypothetical protein